jgi:triosephosphate isomerase
MTNEQIAAILTNGVLPIICQNHKNLNEDSIAKLCVKQYQIILKELKDTTPPKKAGGFTYNNH